MTHKTQGVHDLVALALNEIPHPYNEDIIDEVCFRIEQSEQLMRLYSELIATLEHKWIVNNWIGQYTKQITGGQTIQQVDSKKSTIIGSYTKLKF